MPHHPLPNALDALVRATAERLRLGATTHARVALVAAEIDHAARHAVGEMFAGVSALDLAVAAQRLAVLAGTEEAED